jgi:hypothetical protein
MKLNLLPLLLLASGLGVTVCQANVTFTVTTDTSALVGNAAGTFSLDFQFTDGSGTGDDNNTVVVGPFNFNGGSLSGSPTIQGGALAAAGNVTLADTAFFSELFQGFSPGNRLTFQISLSTTPDAGGTPDQFSFAILDGNLHEIPTKGPANELLSVNLGSSNPQISTFASDLNQTTINIPAPTITTPISVAVPDTAIPNTFVALIWGAALLVRSKTRCASRS